MTGKNPSRTSEDVDATVLNFAEVKAIATGNPAIKRKMELEMELSTLSVLEKQYLSSRYNLEDKILKSYPLQIVNLTNKIASLEKDIELRGKFIDEEPFVMKLGQKNYDERGKAGALILQAINSKKYVDKEIGNYKGFAIIPQEKNIFTDTQTLILKGNMTHVVEVSGSDTGTITRIENYVKNLEKTLKEFEIKLSGVQNDKISATEELKKPFEHTQAKIEIMQELTIVNSELDIGKENISDLLIEDETGENTDKFSVQSNVKEQKSPIYENPFEEEYEEAYEM